MRLLPQMMSSTVRRAILTTVVCAASAVAARTADAGASRHDRTHDVTVHVVAATAPSDGISVQATCGEKVTRAIAIGDGTFALFDLRGRECVIEATAHECYTYDRRVARRVQLPRARVVLVVPDRA